MQRANLEKSKTKMDLTNIDFYVEFRSLLIHCLLPLAHLWLPLAPFWLPLGIFWVLFGAIWFTFAHPMVLFSHFGISQPSVLFYILLYFQRKSYRSQRVLCKLFIARWRKRGLAALKIIFPYRCFDVFVIQYGTYFG